MIDDATFALLNAVYLKKLATVEDLAALTGTPVPDTDAAVDALGEQAMLVSTPAGVMLSDAGRRQVTDYYAASYTTARADPNVVAWYERFEGWNERFIALVSEWQRSDGDAAVLERLIKVADRLATAIDELTAQVPRYAAYVRRFTTAITLVDAGDRDLVANPRRDSIHNIWFEFHEDVLAVLGRPRETT